MVVPKQGVSQDLPEGPQGPDQARRQWQPASVAQWAYYYDYFFNRNGGLLAYRPNLTANHYFLLRNARKGKNLYDEQDPARQGDTDLVQPAVVVRMPNMHKAARQARHKDLNKSFVDTAFVPILSVDVLVAIRNMIRKRERRDPLGAHTDWREYGGYYDSATGSIKIVDSSSEQSPCDKKRIGVYLRDYPFSFHSHPSGEGPPGTHCGFMSAPSLKDQKASSFINYIYGMHDNVLYVCSPQGVVATVRFRLFRRHRRNKLPEPMNSYFTANARFSIKGL